MENASDLLVKQKNKTIANLEFRLLESQQMH